MLPESWYKEKVASLLRKVSGRKILKVKRGDYLTIGKIPIVDQSKEKITGYANDDAFIYPHETPVIVFGDHTLVTKFIDFAFAPGADGTKILHADTSKVDTKFLYYSICNLPMESEGYKRHFSILRNRIIELPRALNEQIRIASILSNWDLAIEQVSKLIEAKTRLKKGLMQQLLVGERRFPQFIQSHKKHYTRYGSFPEDWKLIQMGEIAQEVSSRNSGGNNISVMSCTKYDGLVDSLEYFGKQIYSRNTSNYKVVKRNEFAYATNHIEEGSIGLLDFKDCGLVSPMYTVFKPRSNADPQFLYRLFKTELYRHIFETYTTSSVNRRGSLRWKRFSKIPIALPSIEEQQKIRDTIIASETEKSELKLYCNALIRQKRGLMQVLLTG